MQLREIYNQVNHRFTFTTGATTQEIELWFYVQSPIVNSSHNGSHTVLDIEPFEVKVNSISIAQITDYQGFTADVQTAQMYYPFGMTMPGRIYNSDDYEFGFNGMPKDDEIAGSGNHSSFAGYGYDTRLCRRWSVDPAFRDLPGLTPYSFSLNSPLVFNDQNGKKAKVTVQRDENGGGTITVSTIIYVAGLPENNQDVFVSTMNQETKALLQNGTYVDNEGHTWQIVYDVNFRAGEIGDSAEDQYFNNQLTVNAEENKANPYSGEGFITKSVLKGVIKGDRDKIGTALEESIHFLGLGDQYDRVLQGLQLEEVGFIPKEGYEYDVLTGPVRVKDFEFSKNHNQTIGSFLEGKGLLLNTAGVQTTILNTRISGGIENVQKEKLSPERQKEVIDKL